MSGRSSQSAPRFPARSDRDIRRRRAARYNSARRRSAARCGADRSRPRGSRPPSLAALAKLGIGLRQESRQARGPSGLARRIDDQILADLDLDMRQPTLFAMHRHGVIAEIADGVGFVVADAEIALAAQQIEHNVRQPCVPVVEDADFDDAGDALEYRRKAVHRNQQGTPTAGAPRFQQLLDAVVIWLKNLAPPRFAFGR